MYLGGHFGVGGQTNAVFSDVNEFLWGGDASRLKVHNSQAVVDGSARDAGNAPTSVLRAGLIMGQIAATRKWKQYDPAATDGSEVPAGILNVELVTIMPLEGTNIDKQAPIVVGAPIKARNLFILGAAFIGHAAEFAVRSAFVRSGQFIFDDDPQGFLSGVNRRIALRAANYSVGSEDNGNLFIATAAVTFTLPARREGLVYEFMQSANAAMIVNGGAAHIVAVNSLAGTSVTFNTGSQMIGARARFECVNINGTLRWVYTLLSTGTAGVIA